MKTEHRCQVLPTSSPNNLRQANQLHNAMAGKMHVKVERCAGGLALPAGRQISFLNSRAEAMWCSSLISHLCSNFTESSTSSSATRLDVGLPACTSTMVLGGPDTDKHRRHIRKTLHQLHSKLVMLCNKELCTSTIHNPSPFDIHVLCRPIVLPLLPLL